MNLSRALVVASLLAGAGALTACPALNTTSNVQVPAKGTRITHEIYSQFVPTPKVGQKWTYAVTAKPPEGETQKSETSSEVTKIEGDIVTSSFTILIEGQSEPLTGTATSSLSASTDKDEDSTWISDGADDVTVPFKAYKGAAKFIETREGKTIATIWLVPGVGMVKHHSDDPEDGQHTQELKDFKQP
jgi:hypothetical protein